MSQLRLNHLLVLHVHQDLTDSLDLKAIAQDFVSANDYRGHVFGRFYRAMLAQSAVMRQ